MCYIRSEFGRSYTRARQSKVSAGKPFSPPAKSHSILCRTVLARARGKRELGGAAKSPTCSSLARAFPRSLAYTRRRESEIFTPISRRAKSWVTLRLPSALYFPRWRGGERETSRRRSRRRTADGRDLCGTGGWEEIADWCVLVATRKCALVASLRSQSP